MNVRQNRGQEIADNLVIKQVGLSYRVPSQAGKGFYYVTIKGKSPRCTCLDHTKRGYTCKHAYAVLIFIEQGKNRVIAEPKKAVVSPETAKRTYPQKWSAYNSAQTNEKHLFQKLLSDLCNGIGVDRQHKGRPRIPLQIAVFSCAFKVYTTVSCR